MKMERLTDGFAHYTPTLEPNQRGFRYSAVNPYGEASLRDVTSSGVSPGTVSLKTLKEASLPFRARESSLPIGTNNYKYITLPGFQLNVTLGDLEPGVGYLDITCGLKAPSLLFLSSSPYRGAWTVEVKPGKGLKLIGDALANILVKDDVSHSFAQFAVKQAVRILENRVPEDLILIFHLAIDPQQVDLTTGWSIYNFVAEVVIALTSHTVTRFALTT